MTRAVAMWPDGEQKSKNPTLSVLPPFSLISASYWSNPTEQQYTRVLPDTAHRGQPIRSEGRGEKGKRRWHKGRVVNIGILTE